MLRSPALSLALVASILLLFLLEIEALSNTLSIGQVPSLSVTDAVAKLKEEAKEVFDEAQGLGFQIPSSSNSGTTSSTISSSGSSSSSNLSSPTPSDEDLVEDMAKQLTHAVHAAANNEGVDQNNRHQLWQQYTHDSVPISIKDIKTPESVTKFVFGTGACTAAYSFRDHLASSSASSAASSGGSAASLRLGLNLNTFDSFSFMTTTILKAEAAMDLNMPGDKVAEQVLNVLESVSNSIITITVKKVMKDDKKSTFTYLMQVRYDRLWGSRSVMPLGKVVYDTGDVDASPLLLNGAGEVVTGGDLDPGKRFQAKVVELVNTMMANKAIYVTVDAQGLIISVSGGSAMSAAISSAVEAVVRVELDKSLDRVSGMEREMMERAMGAIRDNISQQIKASLSDAAFRSDLQGLFPPLPPLSASVQVGASWTSPRAMTELTVNPNVQKVITYSDQVKLDRLDDTFAFLTSSSKFDTSVIPTVASATSQNGGFEGDTPLPGEQLTWGHSIVLRHKGVLAGSVSGRKSVFKAGEEFVRPQLLSGTLPPGDSGLYRADQVIKSMADRCVVLLKSSEGYAMPSFATSVPLAAITAASTRSEPQEFVPGGQDALSVPLDDGSSYETSTERIIKISIVFSLLALFTYCFCGCFVNRFLRNRRKFAILPNHACWAKLFPCIVVENDISNFRPNQRRPARPTGYEVAPRTNGGDDDDVL